MRKKLLGGLLVVAILATAGIVAARVNTTEASERSHSAQSGKYISDDIDAQQNGPGGKPFVGIGIRSVPEDSDTDGALIVRVVESSPADGNLRVGDIITAIDDESVSSARDVVRIVWDHTPGDVVVFSVARSGASINVSITVGEREESDRTRKGDRRGGYGHAFFSRSGESFVLSDTRFITDDGVKTVRKAVGTAQNIDSEEGTFDLLLLDESETLSFTIDGDTKISADNVEGEASLSDLNADVTTMVVQVTNPDETREVQLVAQGEFSFTVHSLLGRDRFNMIPRLGRPDSDSFSPRRFFFRWRSANDDDERRGRDYD